jgi:hypothetical protein
LTSPMVSFSILYFIVYSLSINVDIYSSSFAGSLYLFTLKNERWCYPKLWVVVTYLSIAAMSCPPQQFAEQLYRSKARLL